VGIYKEQNRMRQDNSRTPGNRQNGLGIHQEFRNEPGVHKEWWGSVKFWVMSSSPPSSFVVKFSMVHSVVSLFIVAGR